MALTFVGQATGTTSATLPTHQAGDIIVAWAYRDGNNTAPSLPAGWTNLQNGGANTNSARLAYLVATAPGTSSGTWTNATEVVFHVYRGAIGVGVSNVDGAASTTVNYPALTLQRPDGTSWVVGFAGHRSTNTTLETPPVGMFNRSTLVDATAEVAGHDTNGGVASWAGATVAVGGTSSGWRSATVEILPRRDLSLSAGPGSFTVTGQDIDLGKLARGANPAPLPHIGMLLAAASAARTLVADQAAFAITGEAAGLRRGYPLLAGQASFAIAGQAAALRRATGTAASGASFSVAGQAARLARAFTLTAASGSFSIGGQPAALVYAPRPSSGNPAPLPHLGLIMQFTGAVSMTADLGQFAISMRPAGLARGLKLSAGRGDFSTTGINTPLRRGFILQAAYGALSVSGIAAVLRRGYQVIAGMGSFAIAGAPSSSDLAMTASVGAFVVAGQNVGLAGSGRVMPADGALFTITGAQSTADLAVSAGLGSIAVASYPAALVVTRKLVAAVASLAATPQSASLRLGRIAVVTVANFSITAPATALRRAYIAPENTGSFTCNGQPAGLRRGFLEILARGDIVVNGGAAALKMSRVVTASAATINVNGIAASLGVSTSSRFAASAGSFNVSGPATGLARGLALPSGLGSFSTSLHPATLEIGLHMGAAGVAFAITGSSVGLQRGARLALDAGLLTLTLRDANLFIPSRLTLAANPGAVSINGFAVDWQRTYGLVVGRGTFTVAGQGVAFEENVGPRLTLDAGGFVVAPQNINFWRSYHLPCGHLNVIITPKPARLVKSAARIVNPNNVPPHRRFVLYRR
jgi:hypothetical protein